MIPCSRWVITASELLRNGFYPCMNNTYVKSRRNRGCVGCEQPVRKREQPRGTGVEVPDNQQGWPCPRRGGRGGGVVNRCRPAACRSDIVQTRSRDDGWNRSGAGQDRTPVAYGTRQSRLTVCDWKRAIADDAVRFGCSQGQPQSRYYLALVGEKNRLDGERNDKSTWDQPRITISFF